ncbi:MAG: helix-turn-helix domain-containing protein [Fibrobacteres bacterium]|nr:helix-turn-helix domain-containing protein [Fibrobacterota bacterium]
MPERWFSVDEIAAHLGVAKDTVYSWVSTRGMPGHKVGRFWKFKTTEVDDWVRAGGATEGRE